MPQLKGVELIHDTDMSMYSCDVPIGDEMITACFQYFETDQCLNEKVVLAEKVIDSWDDICARIVAPLKEALNELGYEWVLNCDAEDFASPTITIILDPENTGYPQYSILLNLEKLDGHYYVECRFNSLSYVPKSVFSN